MPKNEPAKKIEVSDSIPMPREVKPEYEFDAHLKHVEQSYFVPWNGDVGVRNNLLYAISRFKRKHPGWDFTTKTCEENGVMGTRIWLKAKPAASAAPASKSSGSK